MQSASEPLTASAGLATLDAFPPPPPLPPAPPAPPAPPVLRTPPNLVNQAVPLLPQVSLHVPKAADPMANPFATSMNQQWAPTPAPVRKKSKGSGRRTISWLFVLAVIGGLAYAGFTYGPQLMSLATGDDSIDEPAAPLVFPTATATVMPIRTASFTVERPDSSQGPANFEMTTDFQSGISRVLINRTDAPNLEILTLWETAFIRRVDQPTWYRMDRGPFPVDSEFGITRWVRSLDQVLPAAIRQMSVIDQATQSTVGTEATTHLWVTVDPAVISLATTQPAPLPPPTDGSAPLPTPDAAATLPPGMMLQQGVDSDPNLTMQLWIDGAGVIRKSIMPAELGAETITVTSLSSDEWQPLFPTEDEVEPLTAAAIFELGL
jgi:hypothetical protein